MFIYIKSDCKPYLGLLEPTEEDKGLVKEGKLAILSVHAGTTFLLDEKGNFNELGD